MATYTLTAFIVDSTLIATFTLIAVIVGSIFMREHFSEKREFIELNHDDFLICSDCHFSIRSEGHAIALTPSWIGCGNRPSSTRRYISERDNPTTLVRSRILMK